jgi:hypothetical protein
MSAYTIKNLKDDVENAAEKFGLAPNLEARFARSALGSQQSGLSYQRVAPSFRVPFGHRHAEQEETVVIIAGGGRMKLEDEVHEVRQWDAILVTPGTMRAFEAGPDGAELFVFGAPVFEETDVEMVQGWWSD